MPYFRICKDCGDIKKVETKKLSLAVRCKSCNFDYRYSIHTRICKDCGDKKHVRDASLASAERCRECADEYRSKHPPMSSGRKTKPKSTIAKKSTKKKPGAPKRGPRQHSKIAIDAIRKVNKLHREEVARETSKKKTEPIQVKTDEEMIAEFLAK